MRFRLSLVAAVITLATLAACNNSSGGGDSAYVVVKGGPSGEIYGITADNVLINFNAASTGQLKSATTITGLLANELMVSIDFRPSTGVLYGVTSLNRLYTIDTATAAATVVSTTPFTPPISGAEFDLDFNPVVDRIRLVSDADQNIRLNPLTAQVASVDQVLAYAVGDSNQGTNPTLVGAAYDRSFPGTTATTLYAIDSALDVLVTQGSPNGQPTSPNTGALSTVAALSIDIGQMSGFDISSTGGAVVVAAATGAVNSQLYALDLATGEMTFTGTIGAPPLRDIAIRPVAVPKIYGLTNANALVAFRPGAPETILATVAVTGLAVGESLVGIDFRPSTGALVGVGSSSQVYGIDPKTGAATPVGAPFTPVLAGQSFGVDFNPVVDRLRVVGAADQNFRLNPTTGALAGSDTALAFAATDSNFGADPNVVGAAYDRSVMGLGQTTLYAIDSALDVLVTVGSANGTPVSPNTGQLTTIGALGTDTADTVGFDVSPLGGAYAALAAPGASSSSLFTINLATGAATLVGAIGGAVLTDIAIEPASAPLVFAITASNTLISFAAGTPGQILSNIPITGLFAGETIACADFRPATRDLVGVSSQSRIYTINTVTGLAIRAQKQPFTPTISGQVVGADFDPGSDRLRIVSDDEQNLRVNASNGTVVAIDTTLRYFNNAPPFDGDPSIVAAAYASNVVGSQSRALYAIDSQLDRLVRIGDLTTTPNTGLMFDVGPLGLDTTDVAGFDVSAFGTPLVALNPVGQATSSLYTVNLATGAVALVGTIGVAETVRSITVMPPTF